MTLEPVIKKLEAMLAAAERGREWCEITVSVKDGVPDLVRKMTTEKLNNTMGDTRGRQTFNR